MNETNLQQVSAEQQIQILRAESDAKFALTPVGQELQRFNAMQRMGQMFAQSTLVPSVYQGNIANCAIAVDMATRMGANPLMVMQNLYIVHGNPAWSSKFLIATVNTCGRFLPLQYECNGEKGDAYGWRCYTYAANDTKRENRLEGTWVTWAMVKAEQWDKKPGSKWKSLPELMFKYRAAAFWQRMYAPEISMGFSTQEEMMDVQDVDFVEVEQRPGRVRKSIKEMAKEAALQSETAHTGNGHAEIESEVVAEPASDNLFPDEQ